MLESQEHFREPWARGNWAEKKTVLFKVRLRIPRGSGMLLSGRVGWDHVQPLISREIAMEATK